MQEITVDQLRERLATKPSPFVLDVRQPEEHAVSRIEGAVLIPLGELPTRLAELPRDCPIVVACKSGGRSARATQFLMAQGFTDVANLIGGNDQWQATQR